MKDFLITFETMNRVGAEVNRIVGGFVGTLEVNQLTTLIKHIYGNLPQKEFNFRTFWKQMIDDHCNKAADELLLAGSD
jgi:hypothetical protein